MLMLQIITWELVHNTKIALDPPYNVLTNPGARKIKKHDHSLKITTAETRTDHSNPVHQHRRSLHGNLYR